MGIILPAKPGDLVAYEVRHSTTPPNGEILSYLTWRLGLVTSTEEKTGKVLACRTPGSHARVKLAHDCPRYLVQREKFRMPTKDILNHAPVEFDQLDELRTFLKLFLEGAP